jgi:hypothetical protein
MEINKPKLWKYKSGLKAGKLRPKARKYLSQQVKLYWQTGLTSQERKEREIIKTEQRKEVQTVLEKLKVKKRERKQVVRNSDYSMSIRALVINGKNITEEDLINAIDEFMNSNPQLLNDDSWTTEGMEQKFISEDEDKGLVENKIYIELNIRGKVNFVKW